jgi:hypothetical protein
MAHSGDEGALSEKDDPDEIRVNRRNSRIHIRQTAGTRQITAHLWLADSLRVSSVSRSLLSPTICFRDGFIPATQRTRCCSYNARYLHPNSKHRQGCMWHPARSNRLRFRDCPPHHDSGTSPPLLWRETPNLRCLGHDGKQSRLRRAWTGLRRCLSSALPEIEGETIRRTQQVRPGCNRDSECVSQTSDAHAE